MPPRIEQTDNGSVYVLDAQAVREVLSYTHWIPWKKGFRAEFMRKYYPGWDLTDLIEALKEAGALVKARGSPPPLLRLSDPCKIHRGTHPDP